MNNIKLKIRIFLILLLTFLSTCSQPDSPKSKGIYFKTEIEKAIDGQDSERVDSLMMEMGTYGYGLKAGALDDYFLVWPNDSYEQWLDDIEKIWSTKDYSAQSSKDYEEILEGLLEPPDNAQAIARKGLHFKNGIEGAIKNKNFHLTKAVLSEMGE